MRERLVELALTSILAIAVTTELLSFGHWIFRISISVL